jgi:serine/threonine-protein phosphatase 2A regulatory subunit B
MDGGDSANSSGPWRFAQCFGDKGEVEDITEGEYPALGSSAPLIRAADIISTVEFDHTGDYLATGDKGGRVVLFERNSQVSCQCATCPVFPLLHITRRARLAYFA